MTIFGLNSPELFLLLLITLFILGTKRIEKALDLFQRLLKFLLSNQGNFDKSVKKDESSSQIEEIEEKEEEITKIEEKIDAKEKELKKEIEEIQDKEDKSDNRLKIANLDNEEKKSIKAKDSKGIVKNKNIKNLKTKNSKRIVKDKTVINSKTINVQKEQREK